VLRTGIEDRGDNETRFAWLAHAGADAAPPLRAASAAPWNRPRWSSGAREADHSGWLVRCLDESPAARLTHEDTSRDRWRASRQLQFFADLTGIARAHVAEAIAGVGELCEQVT